MRGVLGCGLAVVLVAAAGADDKKDSPVDPAKLVGKWEPKEALPGGAKVVAEFARDGKLTMTIGTKDKTEKLDGTYKLDGVKLTVTLKRADKEHTEEVKVLKLTDTEFTTEDAKGMRETMRRVR